MDRSTIRIDRVVTRGGDGGQTSLGDGTRLGKDAPRVDAMGAVDEANAAIGALRLQCGEALLETIQRDLFDAGADLCVPDGQGTAGTLRMEDAATLRLEQAVERMNAALPPLTSFVLPAGDAAVVAAHLARVAARRAERRCVALHRVEALNPALLRYLNRLSDYLFVLARWLGRDGAEAMWRG